MLDKQVLDALVLQVDNQSILIQSQILVFSAKKYIKNSLFLPCNRCSVRYNLILLPKFHCLISVILRLLGSAEGVLFINVNNDIGLFFKKEKKISRKTNHEFNVCFIAGIHEKLIIM